MTRVKRQGISFAGHLAKCGVLDLKAATGLPSLVVSLSGQKMAFNRLPFRDPRTVARDIPGVLDVLFPRLSGGLVASLNRTAFTFEGISAVPDELVEQSALMRAMLFELAIARAERLLAGHLEPDWDECLQVAANRQSRHYDAKVPKAIADCDREVAELSAQNLVAMLRRVQQQHPKAKLEASPTIPGMGWIASGSADFSLGSILIEVKHTDRNFVSGDFRQVLMYWILKYASSIEGEDEVWSDCLLLNPRRNSALLVSFNKLLHSASASSNRVELYELLRSIVGQDLERR